MRNDGRSENDLRSISFELGVLPYAEGSCLIKMGNTHVICSATIDENVPPFIRGTNKGWVTAEYGMLPRSTHTRMRREVTNGKPSGRTQEIQRLIGRSLRAITDLSALGERQILIDCDVIMADGGTRCASINGAYVALYQALKTIFPNKVPLLSQVAAISCGILNGKVVNDLNYLEDSKAEVDANFVMSSNNQLIEIQATAEQKPFSQEQLNEMLTIAKTSTDYLFKLQKQVLGL